MAKTPAFIETLVTSTRIRLARNLAGYPFPSKPLWKPYPTAPGRTRRSEDFSLPSGRFTTFSSGKIPRHRKGSAVTFWSITSICSRRRSSSLGKPSPCSVICCPHAKNNRNSCNLKGLPSPFPGDGALFCSLTPVFLQFYLTFPARCAIIS